MNTTDKATYVKPALEDLGTLASRTESQTEPNQDDSSLPANLPSTIS